MNESARIYLKRELTLSERLPNADSMTAPSKNALRQADHAMALPGSTALDQLYLGITARTWLRISIVAVLMAATFRYNLVRLWLKTNPFTGEPNWRHSIFVPLIGLYYLYLHGEELLSTKVKIAWSGLAIMVLGILFFGYAIYPLQNDFAKDLGMVIALFGVVLFLTGWQVMRLAWFPILFLVCALPWPELVYSRVAGPLQDLAAGAAARTLRFTNVDAFNTGTKIIFATGRKADPWRTLNVAEACAGLRSLMTFISVGAMLAFLSARPLWQKVSMVAAAVPIAIFCNVMRVCGQGLLDRYVSQQLSESFAHQFVGLVMLIPGFLLLLLVGWILDKLFIEEADAPTGVVRRGTVAQPTGNAGRAVAAPSSAAPSSTGPSSASPSLMPGWQPPLQRMAVPGVAARPSAAPAARTLPPRAASKPATVQDKSAQDKSAQDKSAQDKSAQDKSAQDKSAQGNSAGVESAAQATARIPRPSLSNMGRKTTRPTPVNNIRQPDANANGNTSDPHSGDGNGTVTDMPPKAGEVPQERPPGRVF